MLNLVARALVFILLWWIAWVVPAQAQPSIQGARFGEHPDKLRFVLDLSEPLSFRLFSLADPFRLVIDFPRFNWAAGQELFLPVNGLVTALRHGAFAPNTSRVVLDLARPAVVKDAFLIPARDGKGPRFVLDLIEVSRESYQDLQTASLPSAAPSPDPDPLANINPPRRPQWRQGEKRPMIVIDPGHGGVDPGTKGASGRYEKSLVLRYSLALREALLKTGKFRVTMTRTDDRFIRLRDRILIAQRAGGDLFVSVHANAHKSRKIRGAAVYTLSEKASDKETARYAARENAADQLAGIQLEEQTDEVIDILLDLTRRETQNLSKRFAEGIIDQIGPVAPLLKNPHRSAGFAVLKSASIPSILFETGYMSNPAEEKLLRSKKHQDRMIAALVKSIENYFAWHQSVSRI